MRASEKKGIMILIGVSILIIVGLMLVVKSNNNNKGKDGDKTIGEGSSTQQGEYTKVESGGTIINTSKKVNEDKKMEGFAISNVQLKEARITNNTNSNQASLFGKVILLDKGNNEIGRIPVKVSETKAGETIEIEASITESYANAYDFKLEK